MYFVKQINPQDTLPLRQKVLKPFLRLSECLNDKDLLTDTYHFGIFKDSSLLCICSWEKENHPDFPSIQQYRLRGMATDQNSQGLGLGKLLITETLMFLKERGCDFVWANARIKAFSFYEKLGFNFHGELFELPRIGPHKVIYKNLNNL